MNPLEEAMIAIFTLAFVFISTTAGNVYVTREEDTPVSISTIGTYSNCDDDFYAENGEFDSKVKQLHLDYYNGIITTEEFDTKLIELGLQL